MKDNKEQPMTHDEVKKLKDELNTLDAKKERGNEIRKRLEELKVSKVDYLKIAIEHILKVFTDNGFGLGKSHGSIYIRNGAFWEKMDDSQIQDFLGEASEKMGVPKKMVRDYTFKEQLFKQLLKGVRSLNMGAA